MSEERVLHCWEDGPKEHVDDGSFWGQETGSTCMLDAGHDGPHEWTPDDKIGVRFAPAPSPATPEGRPLRGEEKR